MHPQYSEGSLSDMDSHVVGELSVAGFSANYFSLPDTCSCAPCPVRYSAMPYLLVCRDVICLIIKYSVILRS